MNLYNDGDAVILNIIGKEMLDRTGSLHYFPGVLRVKNINGELIVPSPVTNGIHINLLMASNWFDKIEEFEYEDIEAKIV